VALEAVVLQIKALAGSAMDPRAFGFIDPPEADSLEAAVLNLKQVRRGGGWGGGGGGWGGMG
jgi:HrpA-like RNA helicase